MFTNEQLKEVLAKSSSVATIKAAMIYGMGIEAAHKTKGIRTWIKCRLEDGDTDSLSEYSKDRVKWLVSLVSVLPEE